MKPARWAVCQTKSDSSTLRLRIARASLVARNMCGWTITARMSCGTGMRWPRGWSMPTWSTRPPNSDGAMLSAWRAPLATASPAMAHFSSSSRSRGAASSAFAATTAATADAAEPPSPEPSGMPLSISTVKPKSGRATSASASSARPAVLSAATRGSSPAMPRTAWISTPGAPRRITVTRSPSASTEKPRMSKPIATLPTEAGAHAVACAGGPGRLEPRPHRLVVARQAGHELRDRSAGKLGRHETLHLHVAQLEVQADLAAENDELARHIRARQVVARVRLGVAALARLADDLREAAAAVVHVEQIGERAGEDSLDTPDLVAGGEQIAQRMHDRQ